MRKAFLKQHPRFLTKRLAICRAQTAAAEHKTAANMTESLHPSSPARNFPSKMTYDQYHLNAPIPNLETESSCLNDDHTFVTNEYDESSIEEDSDQDMPAEVSYESDNEDSEDEYASSASGSDFDESDYESECTLDYPDQDEDDESVSSFQNRTASSNTDHELFLPKGLAPTYESLKYDDGSDSEQSHHPPSYTSTRVGFAQRPTMLPHKHFHRPSNNISDDSEDDSVHTTSDDGPAKATVSFDTTVTVHALFETDMYTPQMLVGMYTNREELRINKLRNKREYAYDDNDWENVTEECDMEEDEDGELIHPVHLQQRTVARGPVLDGGDGLWSVGGGQQAPRAKRMRMYYP